MVVAVMMMMMMMMMVVVVMQHVCGRVGRDCDGRGGQAGGKRHGDEELLEHGFGPWVLD
jgi:hypothetical protein